MGCCGNASWKREEVPDHKFDFIDVRDYYSNAFMTRLRYCLLFLLVFKSFAVYVADIYTAVTLLAFHHFNGSIYTRVEDDPDNNVKVPFVYGKWIFTGCIIFSFCLLAYEANKTRRIIKSRDISYAYTNVMANNYYSMRSYDHFCFFSQINNSKKKKDEFAFFIFFTFKGWKRLLVADGPRQVVNALVLYAVGKSTGWSTDVNKYYEGNYFTAVMLITMIFTVLVFAGSSFLLIIASLMYLPLVCYIKGNLKEYCCHKIDKRITELVQKKKKQRLGKYAAIARAEAAGDFSHLMNKKGIIVGKKIVQPTLPNLDIDALERESKMNGSAGSLPAYASEKNVYNLGQGDDYSSSANLLSNQGYAGAQGVYGHAPPGSNYSFGSTTMMHPGASSTLDPNDAYGVQRNGSMAGHDVNGGSTVDVNEMLSQMGPIGTSPALLAHRQTGRRPPPTQQGQYDENGELVDGRHTPFGSQRNLAGIAGRSPLAPVDSRPANRGDGPYQADAYEMDSYGMVRSDSAYTASQQVMSADGYGGGPVIMSEYAPYEELGDPNHLGVAAPPRSSSRDHLSANDYPHQQARGGSPDPRYRSHHQSFAFGDVYDAYLEESGYDGRRNTGNDMSVYHGEPEQGHYGQANGYGYGHAEQNGVYEHAANGQTDGYGHEHDAHTIDFRRPQNDAQSFRASYESQAQRARSPFQGHAGEQMPYHEQQPSAGVGYALSPPNDAISRGAGGAWPSYDSEVKSYQQPQRPQRQPLQDGLYYQNMQPPQQRASPVPPAPYESTSPWQAPQRYQGARTPTTMHSREDGAAGSVRNGGNSGQQSHDSNVGIDRATTIGSDSRYHRSGYSAASWATSSAANGAPFGYDTVRGSYATRL